MPVVDPRTGGTYYHNPLTDVTTQVGVVMPVWEPVVDPATNGIYWWNVETNQARKQRGLRLSFSASRARARSCPSLFHSRASHLPIPEPLSTGHGGGRAVPGARGRVLAARGGVLAADGGGRRAELRCRAAHGAAGGRWLHARRPRRHDGDRDGVRRGLRGRAPGRRRHLGHDGRRRLERVRGLDRRRTARETLAPACASVA